MDTIVFETMKSYNDYLENVVIGCNEITNEFRSNNISKGLNLVLQFSEGTSWLIDVNKKMHQLGYSNELNHESIREFLSEINTGLEIQDFVLVSDIFEFEIKPFFENCKRYLLES